MGRIIKIEKMNRFIFLHCLELISTTLNNCVTIISRYLVMSTDYAVVLVCVVTLIYLFSTAKVLLFCAIFLHRNNIFYSSKFMIELIND